MRDQIFVSYSHQDRALFDEFKTMLAPAIKAGKLKLWDDTQILPGRKWDQEIKQALAAAKVGVLLVSPNFLASDYIDKNELPPLLDAEGVTIFWIHCASSMYEFTKIAEYQAAHDPSRPLDMLDKAERQAEWVKIAKRLVEAFSAP